MLNTMTAVAAGGTDAATSAGYGLSNMAAGAAAGDDDSAAAAGVDALRSIISSGGDDQSTVDVSIRARAIDSLADSAINAVAALPELTALLGDEDDDTRRRAAEAIGLVAQVCARQPSQRFSCRSFAKTGLGRAYGTTCEFL
jgi:HEAT repeat protein